MKQEEMSPADLAKMTVLYTIPGVESVTVRRDEPYRMTEAGPLTLDVYYPPGAAAGSRLPAVLIVYGYSDAGFPNVFGRTFKEMGATVSWARLIAASGMVAILYSNREPVEDVESVLQYVRDHAASLGIDESRVGLWAGIRQRPSGAVAPDAAGAGLREMRGALLRLHAGLERSHRRRRHAEDVSFCQPVCGKISGRCAGRCAAADRPIGPGSVRRPERVDRQLRGGRAAT